MMSNDSKTSSILRATTAAVSGVAAAGDGVAAAEVAAEDTNSKERLLGHEEDDRAILYSLVNAILDFFLSLRYS